MGSSLALLPLAIKKEQVLAQLAGIHRRLAVDLAVLNNHMMQARC